MSKFDGDGDGKLDYEVNVSNKTVSSPIVAGIQGTFEQKQEQEKVMTVLYLFEHLV